MVQEVSQFLMILNTWRLKIEEIFYFAFCLKLCQVFNYSYRISVGKALVQKVFGPKFHPKFLTLRSKGDDKCPPGMYPTTTNDHFQTIGVDLAFGGGQTVSVLLYYITTLFIIITFPCNVDPLTPHFCIRNWGVQGYTLFSYFCSKT